MGVGVFLLFGCAIQKAEFPEPKPEALTGLCHGEYYKCMAGNEYIGEGYFHKFENGRIYLSKDTLRLAGAITCIDKNGGTTSISVRVGLTDSPAQEIQDYHSRNPNCPSDNDRESIGSAPNDSLERKRKSANLRRTTQTRILVGAGKVFVFSIKCVAFAVALPICIITDDKSFCEHFLK